MFRQVNDGYDVIFMFCRFSKAFDSIPRDTLFNKLVGIGINGKFFNTLKTIYKNDTCRVKLDDVLTNSFVANQGVKQGCVLSPLLFNIFLADLPRHLEEVACGPLKILESKNISCIL